MRLPPLPQATVTGRLKSCFAQRAERAGTHDRRGTSEVGRATSAGYSTACRRHRTRRARRRFDAAARACETRWSARARTGADAPSARRTSGSAASTTSSTGASGCSTPAERTDLMCLSAFAGAVHRRRRDRAADRGARQADRPRCPSWCAADWSISTATGTACCSRYGCRWPRGSPPMRDLATADRCGVRALGKPASCRRAIRRLARSARRVWSPSGPTSKRRCAPRPAGGCTRRASCRCSTGSGTATGRTMPADLVELLETAAAKPLPGDADGLRMILSIAERHPGPRDAERDGARTSLAENLLAAARRLGDTRDPRRRPVHARPGLRQLPAGWTRRRACTSKRSTSPIRAGSGIGRPATSSTWR